MREEEKKQPSRKIGIKRFFKKRWVYPAVYIGAAAILLSTFLWLQAREEDGANSNEFGYESNSGRDLTGEDALEVGKTVEDFEWPVANEDEVEVVTYFYDTSASEEEQEAAIINDGNSFYPSTGIAIAAKTGETFNVLAAMSGTVKSVEEDTVLGNVVTVEHADGVETIYQSLQDVQVKVGDKVKQGDVLAKAGRSILNEQAGVHTHFEIRKDGVPVNPLEYFKKSLTTLQNTDVTKSEETTESEDQTQSGNEEDTTQTEDETQSGNVEEDGSQEEANDNTTEQEETSNTQDEDSSSTEENSDATQTDSASE